VSAPDGQARSVPVVNGDTMVGFGHKQAWLAVREGEPAALAAALGLRDLGPVSWRAGIDLSYLTDDRVAMTPPLAGAGGRWLLATGQWLALYGGRADISGLSAVLGTEVQRFATNRVIEAHEWSRAVDGEYVRVFGYVGRSGAVTEWFGDADETEATLGLTKDPDDYDEPPSFVIGEEDVMLMAGAWSVDPTTLDGQPAPGPLLMFATP
jgi:hypothetical protein